MLVVITSKANALKYALDRNHRGHPLVSILITTYHMLRATVKKCRSSVVKIEHIDHVL